MMGTTAFTQRLLDIQKRLLVVSVDVIGEAKYPYAMEPSDLDRPIAELLKIRRDMRVLQKKGEL